MAEAGGGAGNLRRALPPIAAVVYDRRDEGTPPPVRRGRLRPHRSGPLTLALRGTGRRARVLRAMLVGLLVSVAVTALST